MLPALRRYRDDAKAVLRLIGRDWLQVQVNAMPPRQEYIDMAIWYKITAR
jgi:hypothetical protein